MYFGNHTLYDTAESFNKAGGKYLFIDEVHKYDGWSNELKQIYDAFSDLHVYFTGSSILDIEKGEADLSRRAPRYLMQGMSFREYLKIRHNIECPVFSLEDIVAGKADIPQIQHPLQYFKNYLKDGYYPFGTDVDFPIELAQVITRTLEVDIPQYANMSMATGKKLKKLITSAISEFEIDGRTFEVGGRSKGQRQVREAIEGYVIKDDLEKGHGNVIPLWAFGLNY